MELCVSTGCYIRGLSIKNANWGLIKTPFDIYCVLIKKTVNINKPEKPVKWINQGHIYQFYSNITKKLSNIKR